MLGADAIFGVSGEGDLPCAIVDKGVIQPPHLARWEGFPLGYVSVLSPTDYRAFIALIIERDLYENIPRVKFVAYEMNERVSYRWLIVETVQNFEAAFEAFVRSCTFYYGRQVIDIPSGLNYRQLFGLESWAMERYAIISEHNRAVDATKHEEVKKIKI